MIGEFGFVLPKYGLSDYIPIPKPTSVPFIHAHGPLSQVMQMFAGAERLIREWQTGALTLAQTYAGTATVFVENLAPASSKS